MARVSRYFNSTDWKQTITGDGSIVFTDDGKTVNFSASAGSAAFIINSVVAWPGDSFEFRVMARNIETGKSEFAELIIDSPDGSRRNALRVEASTMEYYTIRYDVPLGASGPRIVDFVLGTDTPTDGSAEFVLPRLDKVLGDDSFLYATFRNAAAGGMTILQSVKSLNIIDAGIVWDAVNLWYKVTPTETSSTLFANGKPDLQATADSGNSTTLPIDWNINGIGDDGSFNIQAIDGNTGVRLDLTTAIGKNLDIAVRLEIK